MAHELDDISRLLGNLESSIGNLGKRFDRLEKRMDERDGTLADIQTAASDLSDNVRFMKEAIDSDIRPVVDDVKRWRLMGMGAIGIVGVGGAAFGSSVLYVLSQMHLIKLP
ncbi:MAG: DUF1515 family protein [Hyphomicrobium sp.]